ncbi:hypothetical protein GCWU000342_02074 [Shuttleworthella satelles DSM 14600]|uniref:Uncharacterized protein n=1 Tax=Shuttleworthella satelles DSM 14600 TaxID=626523 RepID=C4GDA1_9FIRM|nr:hypothetical protein GCWU000342_02074 [Shuttleworthia satelles DSM 14600]
MLYGRRICWPKYKRQSIRDCEEIKDRSRLPHPCQKWCGTGRIAWRFFTVFLCFFAGFFSCEDPFVCGNVLMQEILETGSDGRKNSQSGFVRRDSSEEIQKKPKEA